MRARNAIHVIESDTFDIIIWRVNKKKTLEMGSGNL